MGTLEKLQAEKTAIQVKIDALKAIEKMDSKTIDALIEEKKLLIVSKRTQIENKIVELSVVQKEYHALSEELKQLKDKRNG